MGENSVILQGIENDSAKHSLCSTVHGAGRVMVRMEAKGKTDRKTGEVKRVGKVTQEMMDGWLERGNVELRGAGSDESPDYKRLPDVLAEHGDSIKTLHTLTPVVLRWPMRMSSIRIRTRPSFSPAFFQFLQYFRRAYQLPPFE
jgi:tRNA-splicing ligase RtcB